MDPFVRGTDPHQNVTDPQHWLHQSTQESTQVKEGYFQGIPASNKTLCDKRHPKGRKNVCEIFTAPLDWSLPVNCQTTPGRWSRKYVEEFVTGQAEKRSSLLQLLLMK
jgi:hypothetical protein